MLTCIACSKQLGGSLQHEPDDDDVAGTPSTRQAIKALTAQIKEMALKASGAYRHCKPCAGSAGQHHRHAGFSESDVASGSERFHYSYRRAAACSGLGSSASTPRAAALGKEAESRLRGGLSSGDMTPSSVSGRTDAGVALPAEDEQQQQHKEWVAQVEPGVLITFVSLAQGGNDLKRIRFSREMFNKWQAQRWWAENCEKVMELYNVQRFNRQAVPLPTPPRSEDESSKMESAAEDSPVTPPLSKERLPRNAHRRPVPAVAGGAAGSSSRDSLERHPLHHHPLAARHYRDSGGLATTPKLSSISGAKTETSSMDASGRTSSSADVEEDRPSGELSASVSNASDQEREWVEQDEPGVYITIRALPGGVRELRRVRFSRERFSEMHARLWWEENRARIHEQYL